MELLSRRVLDDDGAVCFVAERIVSVAGRLTEGLRAA